MITCLHTASYMSVQVVQSSLCKSHVQINLGPQSCETWLSFLSPSSFTFYFSKCCSAVFQWRPRNVLWTTVQHHALHQHWTEWIMSDFMFWCTSPLNTQIWLFYGYYYFLFWVLNFQVDKLWFTFFTMFVTSWYNKIRIWDDLVSYRGIALIYSTNSCLMHSRASLCVFLRLIESSAHPSCTDVSACVDLTLSSVAIYCGSSPCCPSNPLDFL